MSLVQPALQQGSWLHPLAWEVRLRVLTNRHHLHQVEASPSPHPSPSGTDP